MRRAAFWAAWAITTAVLVATIVPTHRHPSTAAVILSFLGTILCTTALVAWLAPGLDGAELRGKDPLPDRQNGLFRAFCSALFLGSLISPYVVVPACIILSILVLALARPESISRVELLYAIALALVVGVTTLIAPARLVPRWANAALATANVFLALLAGWTLLRRLGLLDRGVGRALLVSEGPRAALAGFGFGVLVGIPWALWNIALAPAPDRWVRSWWQPLAALAPGIGEEVWGRVLLVSAFAVALAGWPRVRRPLLVAVLVAGFLFGALHGTGVGAIVVGVMLGGLYSVPLSYLWLRRGFEAAIGFHFIADFVRYGLSYLSGLH